MGAQRLDLPGELVRWPEVVVVQKRNELTASLGHAAVAGGRLPGVGLFEVPDAAGLGQREQAGGGVVGRAVVDDDHLVVGERLREDGAERFQHVGRVPVRRDDDGDYGGHNGCSMSGLPSHEK